MSKRRVQLRPACRSDLPTLTEILRHYVKTSSATFRLYEPVVSEFEATFLQTGALRLPFLVATEAEPEARKAEAGRENRIEKRPERPLHGETDKLEQGDDRDDVDIFSGAGGAGGAGGSGGSGGSPGPGGSGDGSRDQDRDAVVDHKILGYAYVYPWREEYGQHSAYQYTVELSIYLAQWCGYRQGIGKQLVSAIMSELSLPHYDGGGGSAGTPTIGRAAGADHLEYSASSAAQSTTSPNTMRLTGIDHKNFKWRPTREVLAIVAVDSDDNYANGQKKFYEACGFKEIGLMKAVGWKFGRWIDVRYMQASINQDYVPES